MPSARGAVAEHDEGHAQLGQRLAQRRFVVAQAAREAVDERRHGVDGDGGLAEVGRVLAQVDRPELVEAHAWLATTVAAGTWATRSRTAAISLARDSARSRSSWSIGRSSRPISSRIGVVERGSSSVVGRRHQRGRNPGRRGWSSSLVLYAAQLTREVGCRGVLVSTIPPGHLLGASRFAGCRWRLTGTSLPVGFALRWTTAFRRPAGPSARMVVIPERRSLPLTSSDRR